MESTKYLIVGGGVASAQAAVGIREIDKDGRVIIVCGENHMPYDHPPLSKTFLLKDEMTPEDPESKDPSFYADNKVEVLKNLRATKIDREAKTVEFGDGSQIQYDLLLLATGSTPKKPSFPGADLDNVFVLRTVDEAEQIRTAIRTCKAGVMIGAGYIGMEVASSARQRGVEATVIDRAHQPWSKFASQQTGDFLRGYYQEKCVNLRLQNIVSSIVGENRVEGVRLNTGEVIPAEFVVIGVGVTLNLELALAAELSVAEEDGVIVDEFFQTSDPSIYAAGDIAAFNDLALGKRWHAEHQLNAKWQGIHAGRIMAGKREPYNRIPYFFSDMFDIHMILRGDTQGGKSARIVGAIEQGEYVELYANPQGKLRMGLAISHNEPALDPISDALETLIRDGVNVTDIDASRLALS